MIRLASPEGTTLWQLELDRMVPSSILSGEEQARAARFRFEQDRHRYCACRSALRIVLGEALGLAPADVVFTYSPYGKPECSLPFNVSHSGGLALIVLGAEGVDIEKIRDDIEPKILGREVFTPSELDAVNTTEDFFAAWTAKEALIKAEGGGFSSPLLQRTVWPTLEPELAAHFDVVPLTTEPGFAAALAMRKIKKSARRVSGGS